MLNVWQEREASEARVFAASGRNDFKPLIVPATEYSDVRKLAGKDGYAWVAPKKRKPLVIANPKRPTQGLEELARIREMSDSHLSAHRLPNQDDYKDKERQLGRPMHSGVLINEVLKLNHRLVCEDSVNCRGSAAFYYFTPEGEKRPTNAHFRKGVLSEFSIVETDAADLPIRVQYGWREVLLRLVRAGQLSLAQVLRVFGDTESVQSQNWRRSVQKFRN